MPFLSGRGNELVIKIIMIKRYQPPVLLLMINVVFFFASINAQEPTVCTGKKANTDWSMYGGNHSEQRFSCLNQINQSNVGTLGLEWYFDLGTTTALEATPLAVAGRLFFTDSEANVYALDAKSGKLLWEYKTRVNEVAGRRLRAIFPVNRGVAYYQGKIYVGTKDGRLIAINADSGKEQWSVQTISDPNETRFISGAPRAAAGKIFIGNGGADQGPLRGYVSAYDAESGELRWRFYTVPGDPKKIPATDKAMTLAATTWTGEWWKYGGGGTVWNAITYDSELGTLYIGTGNGAPWNRKIRSPNGGDNLFLSSIVALDAETGEYQWHYQTSPGETWDYNSTMDIILADLKIDGNVRKVLLHAPKNGFFYVLDRRSGEFISAEKIGRVTWASHIDTTTGRPVENPDSRYTDGETIIYPGPLGARNWPPMSFNPITKLAYFPYHEAPGYYYDKDIDPKQWQFRPFFLNSGVSKFLLDADAPEDITYRGSLMAWDPVTQHQRWEVEMTSLWNGGTLTTAGNLVFQGNADGYVVAYDALTGKPLWQFYADIAIVAPPITYTVEGQQYLSILAGVGGTVPAWGMRLPGDKDWDYRKHRRRLLTFRLDGQASLPTDSEPTTEPVFQLPAAAKKGDATAGKQLYDKSCVQCHGIAVVPGGMAPDLRRSKLATDPVLLHQVLTEGLLETSGMPKYDDLSDAEIDNLNAYIVESAKKAIND